MRYRRWAVFGLLASSSGAAGAIDVQGSRDDIVDFDPTRMTFSEPAKRAPVLSASWDRLDADPEVYLDALRRELRAEGRGEMLTCDGGMLLRGGDDVPELARLYELAGVDAAATEDAIREKRRARMRSISDEALYELEALTVVLHLVRSD